MGSKTTLVKRFIGGKFDEEYDPTIGTNWLPPCSNKFTAKEDSYRKQMHIDGVDVILDILDIGKKCMHRPIYLNKIIISAGQEEFSAMRNSYFRTNDGFLLGYTPIQRSTFTGIANWRESIVRVRGLQESEYHTLPAVLIGHKVWEPLLL